MKIFQNAELLPNFFTKPRFANFLEDFRRIAQLRHKQVHETTEKHIILRTSCHAECALIDVVIDHSRVDKLDEVAIMLIIYHCTFGPLFNSKLCI